MKRYVASAYGLAQTGTDELGNPVCTTVERFRFEVRMGPWHKELTREAGNDFNLVERSLVTRADAGRFEGVTRVRARGREYEVTNVMRDADRTVLTVKEAKPWQSCSAT